MPEGNTMILGHTFGQWITAVSDIAYLFGFGARAFTSFGGL